MKPCIWRPLLSLVSDSEDWFWREETAFHHYWILACLLIILPAVYSVCSVHCAPFYLVSFCYCNVMVFLIKVWQICSSYKSLVKLKRCQDRIFFFLKSSGIKSMLVEIFVLGKLELTAFLLKTSANSGWRQTACTDNPHTEVTNWILLKSCSGRFCQCWLDYLRCLETKVSEALAGLHCLLPYLTAF